MAEDEASRIKTAGRIRDARGRYVTQLDPVAMLLLHQPGIIEREDLQAITSEPGVAISKWERFALTASIVVMITFLILIVSFILTGYSGRCSNAGVARTAATTCAVCLVRMKTVPRFVRNAVVPG